MGRESLCVKGYLVFFDDNGEGLDQGGEAPQAPRYIYSCIRFRHYIRQEGPPEEPGSCRRPIKISRAGIPWPSLSLFGLRMLLHFPLFNVSAADDGPLPHPLGESINSWSLGASTRQPRSHHFESKICPIMSAVGVRAVSIPEQSNRSKNFCGAPPWAVGRLPPQPQPRGRLIGKRKKQVRDSGRRAAAAWRRSTIQSSPAGRPYREGP